MPMKTIMMGPLGGYTAVPIILKAKLTSTGTLSIRPPAGVKWAASHVSITCIDSTGGDLFDASIQIYDGTTTYALMHIASASGGNSLTYGSSASGPIILTHDNWMQVQVTAVTGDPTLDIVAVAIKVL